MGHRPERANFLFLTFNLNNIDPGVSRPYAKATGRGDEQTFTPTVIFNLKPIHFFL
jgi:hypothetical protein